MDWVSMTTRNEAASSQNNLYNKSFHIYNHTKDYFPALNFLPEFIPAGDSKKLCINLSWIPAKMWRVYDKYKQIIGLPTCEESNNPNFKW